MSWRDWDDRFIDGLIWAIDRPRWLVLGGVANVALCGGAYSLLEGAGPIEGGYWGIVTASSTGYGDFSPSTTVGRLVAVYLIVSMIFVWVPAFAAMLIGKVGERTGDEWSHEEQTEALTILRELRAEQSAKARLAGDPPPGGERFGPGPGL